MKNILSIATLFLFCFICIRTSYKKTVFPFVHMNKDIPNYYLMQGEKIHIPLHVHQSGFNLNFSMLPGHDWATISGKLYENIASNKDPINPQMMKVFGGDDLTIEKKVIYILTKDNFLYYAIVKNYSEPVEIANDDKVSIPQEVQGQCFSFDIITYEMIAIHCVKFNETTNLYNHSILIIDAEPYKPLNLTKSFFFNYYYNASIKSSHLFYTTRADKEKIYKYLVVYSESDEVDDSYEEKTAIHIFNVTQTESLQEVMVTHVLNVTISNFSPNLTVLSISCGYVFNGEMFFLNSYSQSDTIHNHIVRFMVSHDMNAFIPFYRQSNDVYTRMMIHSEDQRVSPGKHLYVFLFKQ